MRINAHHVEPRQEANGKTEDYSKDCTCADTFLEESNITFGSVIFLSREVSQSSTQKEPNCNQNYRHREEKCRVQKSRLTVKNFIITRITCF